MNIVEEAKEYHHKLDEFIFANQLPMRWFEAGQDHLALKAYNDGDYQDLIEQIKPLSEFISEVEMDDRRLAAAKLLGEHTMNFVTSFNPFAPIRWVEVMKARPEHQSDEPPRFDHEEIYFPRGIIPIRSVLKRKKIELLDQENASHSWISVIISSKGDELKFTDTRLSDIVQNDIQTGRAKIL